jgi:dephospho-CoA kinase
MKRLIGFTGVMGCGKSTAIELLNKRAGYQGVHNVKFAQPLYDIQEFMYERISSVYERPSDFVKDRKLLQWIGTEWGRDSIKQSLWGDLWQREVEYVRENFPGNIITCDDVRFDNEAKRFKDLGGVIIKIISDRASARITTANGISGHKSERGVDDQYVDFVIYNNGTIEEFEQQLNKVYNIIFGM